MQTRRVWVPIVIAGLTILLVVFIVLSYEARIASDRAHDQDQEITLSRLRGLYDTLAADHQILQNDYETLFERCARIPECITEDVADPDDLSTPEPAPDDTATAPNTGSGTGTTIYQIPTQEQVDAAVASFCSVGSRCSDPPTFEQVLSAVSTYCISGQCRGNPGEDSTVPGPQGEPGQDSTVPGPEGPIGPQGPGPTVEQILAAVTAYCSGDVCKGPKGDTGEPGATGERGPGPTDQQISDAVAAYCLQSNCGPTSEQIAQAVEAYCAANNGCRPEDTGPLE